MKRIAIFKILADLMDFCASEKTSSVSKTGIVDEHNIAD
jgi:hypothetical protein